VTTSAARTGTEVETDASETVGDAARGWYLYGITRRGPLAAVLAEADAGHPVGAAPTAAPGDVAPGDAEPLQLLECCGLAAVVRPVLLADFGQAVLQERLRSASTLEAMVRSHNGVIEAIHARQAILPAKFGMVYAHAREILAALRSECDALLPKLHRLEGCDEWALHLYADRAVVQERIAARNPAIGRLRDEHAAARPGRADFLERRLRDELEAGTRQAMVRLAQGAFDLLAGSSVAGQVSPVGPVKDAAGEVEILRAAFLVARDGAEDFEAAVRSAADAGEGLRCECSGPWPPYSFAAVDVEDAK
jgi:hypothetical protein